MLRKMLAFSVAVGLASAPGFLQGQAVSSDTEIAKGIRQVEDGEYDAAILTLDTASHRLAGRPTAARELSQAYLYLGIAYIGKGHEAAAKAKFREAVLQMGDLSLSPEKFPPRVIDLFEAAKQEARQAPAVSPSPAPRKGNSSKGLLIGGAVAAAAGGVALAAGGGGSGGSASSSAAQDNRKSTALSGTIAIGEQRFAEIVATAAGTLDATVTWREAGVELNIAAQERDPPYTTLNGTYNRTTDTSGRYTAPVTAKPYLLVLSNYSRAAATFDLQIRYP